MKKDTTQNIKKKLNLLSKNVYQTETDLNNDINTILIDYANIEMREHISKYTHYVKKTKTYKINTKKTRITNENFNCLLIKEKIDNIKELDINNNTLLVNNMKYEYPKEDNDFNIHLSKEYQYDDEIIPEMISNTVKFTELRKIISPEQRSPEWFELRETAITASDGSSALGTHKYETLYSFLFKKLGLQPFETNAHCYHGTKYEQIATMIYEIKYNVYVEEFGLMKHPKISHLAASPDGICSPYKFDKVHLSNKVGTMLEIKCPVTRSIHGEIPHYYWVQIQQQLECCDLDVCDFWQCVIEEYNSKEEFIKDTNPVEPYKSLEYGLEKGCIIQLLPKKKINNTINGQYKSTVYESSKFIYPPSITMTPYELDMWIAKTISVDLLTNSEYFDYVLDKVYYWKLKESKCEAINRDTKWFIDHIPQYEKVWNYIIFFRNNPDKLDLWYSHIMEMPIKKQVDIYLILNKLYDVSNPNYNEIINEIKNNINNLQNTKQIIEDYKKQKEDKQNGLEVTNIKPKKTFSEFSRKKQDNNDIFMFR
jgi:putative phage-type endonuclease